MAERLSQLSDGATQPEVVRGFVDPALFLSPELIRRPSPSQGSSAIQSQGSSNAQLLGQRSPKRRRLTGPQHAAAVYTAVSDRVQLWVTAAPVAVAEGTGDTQQRQVLLHQPFGRGVLCVRLDPCTVRHGWTAITASSTVGVPCQAVVCVPPFPAVVLAVPVGAQSAAVSVLSRDRPLPLVGAIASAMLVVEAADEDCDTEEELLCEADLAAHCSTALNINASSLFGAVHVLPRKPGNGGKPWAYRIDTD